jgi:hypothetical protein
MHSSQSAGSPSQLPCHAGWIDVAIVWARSPMTMNGASHGLHGEKAEAPNTPHTILDMGYEQPFHFPLWYK